MKKERCKNAKSAQTLWKRAEKSYVTTKKGKNISADDQKTSLIQKSFKQQLWRLKDYLRNKNHESQDNIQRISLG